jgi:hypothetical protein
MTHRKSIGECEAIRAAVDLRPACYHSDRSHADIHIADLQCCRVRLVANLPSQAAYRPAAI